MRWLLATNLKNPVRQMLMLGLVCLLTACGGGGSGSSPPPAPPPVTNMPPTASFSLSPGFGDAPLTVAFDGSASTDSDGVIGGYFWEFGDSNQTTGIGATAQHTYPIDGSFTIRLTVTDDDGATTTTATNLTVNPPAATARISGTIQILASSAIDSDVNDRFTTPVSNNDFANAQPVPNPVTLGGFANIAGSGSSSGNLFASGDPGDFYYVSLTGNELITLTFAGASADLDLRLWDDFAPAPNLIWDDSLPAPNLIWDDFAPAPNLIDASAGSGSSESLNATSAGNFFVEVVPVSGASNYVLTIGQDVVSMGRTPSRISDPFVPGEIIVQSDDPELSSRYALQPVIRRASPSGRFALLATDTPNRSLLRAAQALSRRSNLTLPGHGRLSLRLARKYQTLLMIKGITSDRAVISAEPNLIRRAHKVPTDPLYGYQWHYPSINLPLAWDLTRGDTDVIVAVIDTGVLVNHPDLDDQLVPGYDFVSNTQRANDGDGIDSDPNDPGDLAYGGSSSFHGTHVAGTIAAESNDPDSADPNPTGVAGVAWNARIMPVRALGVDGGTTYDVLQALRFAAGLPNDSGTVPVQRADVINMSLGSSFSSQSEQAVVNEVRALGIFIVASAGNESSTLPSYPAAYVGVISVSATTISNSLAPYSNTGSTIDVAAPGGYNATDLNGDGIGDGVVSTMGDDGSAGPVQFAYAALSGTSMAAPHVAGVIALMKAVHPNLTPTEFDMALRAGDLTDDLGIAGFDESYGHGLINAHKAVVTALALATGQGSDPGPVMSASVSTLNFGVFGTSLDFTLQNVGTGTVRVQPITASEPWLSVAANSVDDNGLGSYEVRVDRSGITVEGTYSASISIIDFDANEITISIIMQVSSLDLTADAGQHYIILVNEDGISALPATVLTATNGVYDFVIENVPTGQYQLFAGTDSNDDDFLCDTAEACGAYRTLDSPDLLNINGDMSGLDFVSGFRTNLSTLTPTAITINGRGISFTKPNRVE